jgi:hypothetical protein
VPCSFRFGVPASPWGNARNIVWITTTWAGVCLAIAPAWILNRRCHRGQAASMRGAQGALPIHRETPRSQSSDCEMAM